MVRDKIVKIQTKGMVTIPVEFREALGIDEQSLLQATIVNGGVLFIKMSFQPSSKNAKKATPELYSDAQIRGWLKEDKIDPRTVAKLKKIIKP